MSTTTPDTAPLTVVLVHGAFTDASSWNGVIEQHTPLGLAVIERLQAAGVQVTAPPNPLRGLSADSAYISRSWSRSRDPSLPSVTRTPAR